jgi:hypothetical protein
VRSDVAYEGHLPSGIHDGEIVPAVDTGAPSEVFQPGNRTAWLGTLALTVLGAIWVLASAGAVVMRVRSRRWPTAVTR